MRDPQIHKLAEVLVSHSTRVGPGDLVTIIADPGCMAAVGALFEAVLRAGGNPSYHARSEALQEVLLTHASEQQLRHICPFEAHRLATCDVMIVLRYTENTRLLAKADPQKAATARAARRSFLASSLKRKALGEVRYVLAEIPSNAAAQDADMSLTRYENWVFRAGMLHLPDPVAAWQRLREQQELVRAYLSTKRTLRFKAPAIPAAAGYPHRDGTDLTVDISGRTWINCAGEENFPDGEVYTGPRGVDGVVNFTYPAIYAGVEVEGIRLEFRGGRVADASATRNQDHLLHVLDQDDGARTAGEIALGTNYCLKEFSRNVFFDEKIGGTFHLALGAGYPETGNTNESSVHWDIVSDLRPDAAFRGCPGGTIHADGELIQRDGLFLLPGWSGNEQASA